MSAGAGVGGSDDGRYAAAVRAIDAANAEDPNEAVNLVEQMLRAWDQMPVTQGFTRSK